ncbi:MAG: TRAP transporter substrate-binding protein DctP, partial [Burkholderiales bacterium]|nr:TRAP transporter substrate-binding protein DctP [Burkholderiales bacterium]
MASRGWLLALFAFASIVQAQAELKLSTAQGHAYPLGRAGQRWTELLNENAAGAFVVRQYPGAVLSMRDPQREFGALRDGAADLAVGSALAWFSELPAFGVYVLPWLTHDAGDQEALADDAIVRDAVAAAAAQAGVVVIVTAALGERVVATTKAALQSPAQLAGLRLRAPANPLVAETLGALGARAQAMNLADAQAALAAGTLDGQEAAASTLATTRIVASGQRYVTRWGAFADVMVFAVRQGVWDGWSADQRTAAQAAATQAARDAGALAREDAALAELTRQGVTLVRLST